MKRVSAAVLALGLLAQPVLALETFKSPDIIIDSKLDFNWSEMLVNKIRRLMVNKGYEDPFKSKVQKEILISDIVSGDLVAPESKQLLKDLGDIIGVKLLNSKSSISIKNFAYEIGSVTTDLKTSRSNVKGLIINGDLAVSNIRVVSDEIRLILELPTVGGGKLPLLQVAIKKPFINTKATKQFTMGASIQVMEGKGDVSFNVLSSDFGKVADLLARDPRSIELGYESLEIPAVSVRIGTKEINIKPEKVRDFITKREDSFKALLVDQLRVKLREGAVQPFLKVIQEQKLAREYWIDTDTVASQFNISKILSNGDEKNLQIDMTADFCVTKNYVTLNRECIPQKATKEPLSVISAQMHERSLVEIRDTLSSGDANMMASVSENYINKLLGATFDAGLYETMLSEAGARIGDKGAFIRLDEKGDTGTLYADVVYYKIKGFEAFVTGAKEVRFPLVIKCSMRFEKKNGIPLLLIKMVDADLSDQVLRYGIPELGLVSTIQKVPRFKGQVIKAIKKSMADFLGKDVVSLDYPEFMGLGLETVIFHSDGNGRMGAQVRLDELIRSEEEDLLN